jgi:hypothetical protein
VAGAFKNDFKGVCSLKYLTERNIIGYIEGSLDPSLTNLIEKELLFCDLPELQSFVFLKQKERKINQINRDIFLNAVESFRENPNDVPPISIQYDKPFKLLRVKPAPIPTIKQEKPLYMTDTHPIPWDTPFNLKIESSKSAYVYAFWEDQNGEVFRIKSDFDGMPIQLNEWRAKSGELNMDGEDSDDMNIEFIAHVYVISTSDAVPIGDSTDRDNLKMCLDHAKSNNKAWVNRLTLLGTDPD